MASLLFGVVIDHRDVKCGVYCADPFGFVGESREYSKRFMLACSYGDSGLAWEGVDSGSELYSKRL